MARGTARRGGPGRTDGGAAPPSDAERIIAAAAARIAADGWRRLSLAAVAAEADLPILRVYRSFSSKSAILRGLFQRLDEAVLDNPPMAEPDERPRDRLFDLLMRRFDALNAYKPALARLRRELPREPLTALCAGGRLLRSMRWMLEAAEIRTDGWRGAVAVRATAAAYLSAMRVWQDDDQPDLGRTMAALDARLRRVERWLEPAAEPRRDPEPAPA